MRLLVVDDHPLFAEALAARLTGERDVDAVLTVDNVDRALAIIEREHPTVVVLDYMLGDESGLTVLHAVRRDHPGTWVVMLSGVRDLDAVVEAVRLGARAWVPKSADIRQLVSVIQTVVRGGAWLPEDMLGGVLDRLTMVEERAPDALAALTSRERQVLQCMIDGLPRAQIASQLYLSPNTVRTHIQNLLAKLECHSLLEAVALARRNGMRRSASGSSQAQ